MDLSSVNSIAATVPGLSELNLRPDQPPAVQRQAVATQFEAILLRQFLSQSVGSMMGGEKDAQGGIYSYFLTDVLSQKLAAGGGMGLAKIIAQQLAPAGEQAAKPQPVKPL